MAIGGYLLKNFRRLNDPEDSCCNTAAAAADDDDADDDADVVLCLSLFLASLSLCLRSRSNAAFMSLRRFFR